MGNLKGGRPGGRLQKGDRTSTDILETFSLFNLGKLPTRQRRKGRKKGAA